MGGGISSSLEPPPIFTRRVPKWGMAKMGGGVSSNLEPPPVYTHHVLLGYQRRPEARRAIEGYRGTNGRCGLHKLNVFRQLSIEYPSPSS